MRTSIDIDDELMKRAMKVSGAKTKKATVHQALELLIRIKGDVRSPEEHAAASKDRASFRELRGKIQWIGSLEESRKNRF